MLFPCTYTGLWAVDERSEGVKGSEGHTGGVRIDSSDGGGGRGRGRGKGRGRGRGRSRLLA